MQAGRIETVLRGAHVGTTSEQVDRRAQPAQGGEFREVTFRRQAGGRIATEQGFKAACGRCFNTLARGEGRFRRRQRAAGRAHVRTADQAAGETSFGEIK